MKKVALISLILLSGCGTLNSTVAGFNQKAISDTRGANDNLVHALEAGICEVPIGAVIRNSEFVPVAKAACLPAGQASSPLELFVPISGVK